MDSASGSMQSSSGGDEEYDSRAESISSLLKQNTNNNHNPLNHHHVAGPMAPPQHHHSTVFEPLSSFFDPLSTPSSSSSSRSVPSLSNTNSLLNLDMVWSKNIRSEPNCTDFGGFMSASALNQPQNRPNIPSAQIPPPGSSNQLSVSGQAEQITINQHNNNDQNNHVVGRNPKKRPRASRRAPTTVLTTDTSNFRAMVQEFTGIPAPPFTSTPFPRTRLDLYGTSSPTLRSAAAHLEAASPPHPAYLLRPFAQKIQQSTSSFLSSSIDAIVSATTTAYTNINTSTTPVSNSSTSINYQQPPHNLLNISMQNPFLNFQPLLPPPKNPLPNSQILDSAAHGKSSQPHQQQQVSLENIQSGDSHLKISNLLEDFALGHGLQSMVPQQDLNESGHDQQQQQQGLLMSINANYNSSETVGRNSKAVNFSASSTSDSQGDKAQDNVVKARSEGMMESWICSSD